MPVDSGPILQAMAQVPLFAGLPAAEQARLAPALRRLSLPPQTNLMALDQPAETVYAIVEGSLRVQVEQAGGALVILAFLGPGDIVGEMSLLESAARSATVITLEPCRLLWLDRATFRASVETMPGLALNLLRVLSARLRQANERIQILATLDVAGRVARQLAAFADAYGVPAPASGVRIPLRLTQADLADIVGASRERVNQAMVDLKQRGIVAVDAEHRVTILDRAGLDQRYA